MKRRRKTAYRVRALRPKLRKFSVKEIAEELQQPRRDVGFALRYMWRVGELERVSEGTDGKTGKPAVYKFK